MKHWFIKIIRFFFLILFLGYFGSTTLFIHTHHIGNGATIVHSHPFNSGTEKNSTKHQHSVNEYILIQFLSYLLTTLSFIAFLVEVYKNVLKKYILKKNDSFSNLIFLCSNGLRATPLNMLNNR